MSAFNDFKANQNSRELHIRGHYKRDAGDHPLAAVGPSGIVVFGPGPSWWLGDWNSACPIPK